MKTKEEKLQAKLDKAKAKAEVKANKPKKPIYKKWWFYAVIVLVVIIIAAAAGGGGSDPSTDNTADNSTTTETTDTSSDSSADTTEEESEPEMTSAQENAYQSAKDYLNSAAFSRQGLIDQLSSDAGDGYAVKDAEFAVDLLEKNKEVNWKDNAYQAAKDYLDMQSFSKDGLIEQLESEYGDQYTHDQAVYGANKAYDE